jgi:WD40 repeat protein
MAVRRGFNEHAEALFLQLSERERQIAEVVFTRLSERDAENRYRRSPATVEALIKLAGCTLEELERVVSVFSAPSVSFIDCRPLANSPSELVDVSHESLIRQWDRLKGWADEEAEKVRNFRMLAASAQRWGRHERSDDFLKSGGDLEVWEQWWKTRRPTRQWAERYAGDLAEKSTTLDQVDLADEYLGESQRLHQARSVRRKIKIAALALIILATALAIPAARFKVEKLRVETLQKAKYETAADRGAEVLHNEDPNDPNFALLLALAWLQEAKRVPAVGWFDTLLGRGVPAVYVPALEALAYEALQAPRPSLILSSDAPFPTATFSPDGRLLLTTRASKFQVWDITAFKHVTEFTPPALVGFGRRTVWSHNAQWIIGATDDGARSVLFAPCSVDALRQYFARCENNTTDIVKLIGRNDDSSWPSALNPTGDRLLSGGFGAFPKMWQIDRDPPEYVSLSRGYQEDAPPQPGPELQGSVGFAFAFNREGTLFALGGQDGSVRVHSTDNPTERMVILRIPKPVQCASNVKSGTEEGPSTQTPVGSIAFSPKDDHEIASVAPDGCVRLWRWNLEKQDVVAAFKILNTGFFSIAFDLTGQRIAVTSDDSSVRVWETGNPDEKGSAEPVVLRGHRRAVWVAEFSRETELLASGSGDSTRIWTLLGALRPSPLPPGAELSGSVKGVIRHAEGHEVSLDDPSAREGLIDAAVSPNRDRVLVADRKTLKLYDLRDSSAAIAKFNVPRGEWKAAGFLRNPDRIVGETTDGNFYTWPFFQDVDSLIAFACTNLPVEESGTPTELSASDKERFRISAESRACLAN